MTLGWFLSIALVVGPVLLLVWQQLGGIFTLNIGAYDKPIFTAIMSVLIALGFTFFANGAQKKVQIFLLSIAILIGAPLIFSGMLVTNDAMNGTEITTGTGFWFAMDTISSQVAEWGAIIQIIVGLVPAAVIVIGVVMIFAGDGPDEYMTAFIEIGLAVVIMVVAALAFGWMGISIF